MNLQVAATPPVVPTSTRFIDAAHLTLQPLLLNAISVFALAFIIRCLGPTAFGQWAVATTLNAAVLFLVSMGLRPLFVRALTAQPQRAAALLAQQLALRAALGVLAGGVATAAALALGYPPVIVAATALVGVSTLLCAVWTTFADFLQAFQRVRVTATVGTIAGLVVTVVSVTVAWAGGGAVALAASYITGPLITSVGLGYLVADRLATPVRMQWNTSEFRRLLTDSRSLALQLGLNALRDRGEQLLVPRFLGIEAFGFFAAGMMPLDRLEAVPDSLNTSYFTSIARSYGGRGSPDRARHDVRQLLLASLAACLAASFTMSAFAPLVARLLFRGGAGMAEFVMMVTVWALPLAALSGSMASVLQATGHHRQAARAGIVSTLVGSGTSLALIALIGLPGAAYGVVIRHAIGLVVIAIPFSREIGSLPRILPLRRIAVAAGVTAMVLWSVSVYAGSTTASLIAGNLLGLVVYGALLFLLRIIPWPSAQVWSEWRRSLGSVS